MEDALTVSIVVPSYNHGAYLPKTVATVLAQTYEDWELAIVDDGSTDDTLDYLRSLDDPRIRWTVNESNLGTYGNLNRAMDLAQGEFIAVLNSDDLWKPDKLRRQMETISRHPEAQVCYTYPVLIDPDDSPRERQDHHWDWPTDEVQSLVPYEIGVNRVLASSAVFRRGSLRFDDRYRYSGDWLAMLEAAHRGVFCFVNEPLTQWRIHPSNAHKDLEKTFMEEIAIRQAILDAGEYWFVSHSDPKSVEDALGGNALRLNKLFLLCGDRPKAMNSLHQAERYGANSRTVEKWKWLSHLPLRIARTRVWKGLDWQAFELRYQQGSIPSHHFVSG